MINGATVHKTRLVYQYGKHNKFYEIELLREESFPNLFIVRFNWGRIGTNGQTQDYVHLTRNAAEHLCDQKAREKFDKGYILASSPNPIPVPPPVGTAAVYPIQYLPAPIVTTAPRKTARKRVEVQPEPPKVKRRILL